MRHILFILLVLAFSSAYSAEKAAQPDFSTYPAAGTFRFYLNQHLDGAALLKNGRALMILEFPRGENTAFSFGVSESGAVTECCVSGVVEPSIRHIRRRQLSESDQNVLKSAIKALPAESVSPPLERLVIVSFRVGADWITRIYDRASLPKPMALINETVKGSEEARKAEEERLREAFRKKFEALKARDAKQL